MKNKEKKVALIVGITGQDGAYLAKLLLSKNYEVFGTSRDADFKIDNLSFVSFSKSYFLFPSLIIWNLLDPVSSPKKSPRFQVPTKIEGL